MFWVRARSTISWPTCTDNECLPNNNTQSWEPLPSRAASKLAI